MRRVFIVLFILILMVACRTLFPTELPSPTKTALPYTSTSSQTSPPPTTTPTDTPSQTLPPIIETPQPLVTRTSAPTAIPDDFEVHTHPDGELYIGDLVSLEVIVPPSETLEGSEVSVQADPPDGQVIGSSSFAAFGIQGRQQATMTWIWDTYEETAGEHILNFTIQPSGFTFTKTITLLPVGELPADEAGAVWNSATSDCCTVWYMTNTASERDLSRLLEGADVEAQSTIDQMGIEFSQPITITILPRLLGHGGFAADEIHVSYLDRNYATNSWDMVLHHEMIHILDRRLGGELRPSLLVEGLAVYQAGGHYKKEDLLPRAAALLPDQLDWYIPLDELTDDFYASQHEIGYLEAGALVAYMVDRWGWEAYSDFYRDIQPQDGGSHFEAIDFALKAHFGISFSELEGDFISALSAQIDAPLWVDDVRLTVIYYDTLRRYQQILDPSAYFRTAWLLDTKEMRDRDIIADYYRHPTKPANLALETLMIAASEDISLSSYERASEKLWAVNDVLDAIEVNDPHPFSVHPLASSYLGVVNTLTGTGYQAQKVDIQEGFANALVTATRGEKLIEIMLQEFDGTWTVLAMDTQSLRQP